MQENGTAKDFQVLVGTHLDKVLRGEGLLYWDGEGDGVIFLCKRLLQQEVLAVQELLAVTVLHQNPEWLHETVNLFIPLEVWRYCQVHLQMAEILS